MAILRDFINGIVIEDMLLKGKGLRIIKSTSRMIHSIDNNIFNKYKLELKQ
jgi:hypothetical protein